MNQRIARIDGVNMEILHDVKNLVGIVHAAAIDLERAHASGEDLGELLEELVSLTALVSESLRGLAGDGTRLRPFDLRAAAFCARVWQSNIAVGALLREARVDAEAGELTDFVIALAVGLGAGSGAVSIQQDLRPGLRFEPAVRLESMARQAVVDFAARAESLSLSLEAEDGCVRLRARTA